MTAATLSARNDGRVPCPRPDCTYSAEPGSSIAGHVAMAHPEVPMAEIAPKRRVVDMNALPEIEHDADCPTGFHAHVFTPVTPAVSPAAGVAPTIDDLDQRWLDDRIAAIEDGIEAVLDIAREWTGGRNLARLHPGTSAQDYVLAHVRHPLGRGVVLPLLAESDWSNRQIATIAGVSEPTVRRVATASFDAVDRPAETLGADGKYRPGRVVRTVVAEVIDTPSATDALAAGLKAAAVATAPAKQRHRPSANPAHIVSTFCRMTSKSTGQGRQQPERWLMQPPAPAPMEVCQQHGKMLERQGWQFVRELHPVPGFDRDGRTPEAEA